MSLNCVAFNQDYSHLAIGTSNGFRVYTTEPYAKVHQTYEGNISLMEMLFSTSLIALVLSPRRLVITNTKRNSTICELTFPTTILSVKLNRKRLVVVLENQIYVYDISNMKLVHTVNTSPNPQGVCALSPASDRCYLVYPLPQSDTPASYTAPPSHVPPTAPHTTSNSGHVLVFDPVALQAVNVIEAHRAPLSFIATNREGTRLATASDKGTIIRVFSIPDGQKLFQFRRGSMPSRIFSMSFNYDSTMLCVSSATDTVHIFKLTTTSDASAKSPTERVSAVRRVSDRSISPGEELAPDEIDSSEYGAAARKHNGTFSGMIRRTSQNVTKSFAASIGGYLPSAVTEMLEPARDFAWFKVPRPSGATGAAVKSIVAMSPNGPQVMVVTSEGDFLVYNIDMEKGGEAELIKQQSVLQSNERSGRATLND